jgi:MerR family transcriptional regulator, copper efflux regulator
VSIPRDDVPIVCTLDTHSVPERLAEWRALLDHAIETAPTRDGAVMVQFDGAVPVAELARLVAAEQQCCAFLSFRITLDAEGITLEVNAPHEARGVVDSLLGRPA